MTHLEKRQEEMRLKHHARRLKGLRAQFAKVRVVRVKKAVVEPVKEPEQFKAVKVRKPNRRRPITVLRASVPGDHSAEKLDRMEELAYRIARRKWQKCL